MPTVRIKGVLYEKTRDGKNYRKGYFVVIKDGRMLRNLGEKKGQTYTIDKTIEFSRELKIIAKGGAAGLAGLKVEGGSWYSITLKPSSTKKIISLRMPYANKKEVSLKISGEVELSDKAICEWCENEIFINEEEL